MAASGAALRSSPVARPIGQRRRDDDGDFVADAERVPGEERREGERDGGEHPQRHQQRRTLPPDDRREPEYADRDQGQPHQPHATQFARAFENLLPHHAGLPLQGGVRHIEPAADEPLTNGGAAEEQEEDRGADRVARHLPRDGDEIPERGAAPPSRNERQRDQRAHHRPRLVAREARRDHPPSKVPGHGEAGARGPVRQQPRADQRGAEEQRLGHRRGVQVEDVRVGREQHRAQDGPGARAGQAHHHRGNRRRADAEGEHRDEDGERAGAIGRVHLHRHHVQDVRQRQPHRANLLPAGRDAVEDAP